jgi:hypothetical protein
MTATATLDLCSSTRMLLACDGSTMILLEALLGEKLSVRVDAQGETDADRLPRTIRDALRLAPGTRVLERRSCLLATADQEVISVNRVVLDDTVRRVIGDPDPFKPIGAQLRERGIPQHREQLSSGLARWRDGSTDHLVPAAYKEYVINYAPGGRSYVHECFNPRWVSVTPDQGGIG